MATNQPVPPTLASLQAQIDQLRKEVGLEPLHNNDTLYKRMIAVEGVPLSSWNKVCKPLGLFCGVGAAGCAVMGLAAADPGKKAVLTGSAGLLAGLATLFNSMATP